MQYLIRVSFKLRVEWFLLLFSKEKGVGTSLRTQERVCTSSSEKYTIVIPIAIAHLQVYNQAIEKNYFFRSF